MRLRMCIPNTALPHKLTSLCAWFGVRAVHLFKVSLFITLVCSLILVVSNSGWSMVQFQQNSEDKPLYRCPYCKSSDSRELWQVSGN